MFSKAFIATVALAGAVSALPSPNGGGSTGAQCCQNVENWSSVPWATKGLVAGLLGVAVSDLNVPIGTGCTPVSVLGGVSCNTNTVNCGQYFGAELIGVDCVPVTVNTKRTWTPPAPTGGAQCCEDVENSSSVDSWTAGIIKGLLGVDVSSLNIPIGTGCTPVSVLGGVSCNTNTVQCGEVDQLSLVGINCVPVTVNTKRNWTPPAPTGGAQCCQDVENSSSVDTVTKGILYALLGIDISSLNIPIGTGCAPISVGGGVSCNTNTVQCGEVDQKSLVGINCVPVTVNTKRNWTPPAPSSAPQCCQNVTNSNSVGSGVCGLIDTLIGVDVSSLNIPIGTGCTPVSVLGGVSCNTNTVSCGEVFQESLIGVNCIPVTVNA